MQIVVGIITISDRASRGQYQDLGGPAVKAAAEKRGWDVLAEAIIPDDKKRIQETVRSFSAQGCGLILTTGGTGVADRDVTPEAIREIMRVEIPGFGEVMRAESMKITPNGILSRSLAAIIDGSLVIALPANQVEPWNVSALLRARFRTPSRSRSASPLLVKSRNLILILIPIPIGAVLPADRI